jgi:YVTN family beta-propeller protein
MTHALLAILLVLNKADATLVFVDPSSGKIAATIPTGEGPHEVAVTADGRTALVANYGTGPNPGTTVSIIDVEQKKEKRRLALPGLLRPHGVFTAGSHIYLTAEGSRVVARFDAAFDRIDWISGTGQEVTHMVVGRGDERTLYTANIGSDSVTVIDLADAPRRIGLKQVAVGKGPEGIDLSPDGKELWTAHRGDGALSIIDTATETVVRTLTTGTKMANRVKFTPDGKRVLISDPPSNQVLVYDASSKELVKKIATNALPSGILIAPDGKRAYVACAGAGKIDVGLIHYRQSAGRHGLGRVSRLTAHRAEASYRQRRS